MHRSGRIVALVATIVLFCSGCDWLQWGSGATHRGVIFDNAITKAGVAGFVASTMLQQPTSSPTATAHDLVFVERDGKLTALDARSYAVVWTAILPSGTTAGGAPAISGSTVFVTVGRTGGPQVLGFDVDGVRNCNTVLFTCSPTYRARLGVMAGPASPPVIDGGRVFVNAGSSLYALDAKGQTNCTTTGGTAVCNPLWSASTGTSASGIGPAVVNNIVYDAVAAGGTKGLGAFQGGTGNLLWTGDLGTIGVTATPSVGSDGTVFVPSGPVVAAFDGDGCGAASCARVFELAAATGDPLGDVFSTPAVDGTSVYATNARGRLYAWPSAGCGSASCQPSFGSTVDAPGGGATAYRQTPAISNGVLFLLAHRVVGGADHSLLLALDEVDASELAAFDLGTSDFGAGLANASIANAVIYAPLAGSLVAVHAPPVQPLASLSVSPLALSPAFSPSTLDYVVRCAAGTNQLTIDMAAEAGGTVALVAPITTDPSPSQSENVQLDENQAAVIEATNAAGASARYWIRCLPHDFPPLNVATHPGTGAPTPGWYLAGNNVSPSGAPSYAMILDINGTPVWYKRSPAGAALNVTPLGHDEVAFMAALPLAGYGTDPAGKFDVYNLDTNQTSSIRTVGVPTDIHELYQLANGNHLLLSYALKRGVDLTGLVATPTPGPNSTIADCVVQEVDPSGQLVWQWTASDHADPVTESTIAPSLTLNGETVYDVFHCNSIDPNAAGDVLVSARHLNAIVYVRRSDGKIVWKMGGKPVNKDGATIIQIQNDPEVGIVQQHDARFMPNNHVSLYDNQSNTSAQPARGVEYAINFTTNTAQPVFSFVTPTNAASCCMGSLRRLPDGHRVVGWGYVVPSNGAILTELDASGNDVLDLAFAAGYASYRAVKVPPPRFDVDALRATAGQ